MANTCFTYYIIRGDKKEIARLKKDLMAIKDPEDPNDREPWAGFFLEFLGENPEGQDCRGGIPNQDDDLEITEDGTELHFTTESKWRRMTCLEQAIQEHYGVAVWYLEEECGNEVFVTNDEEHVVFPKYVIVDGEDLERDDYYFTPEDARTYLSEILEGDGKKPEGYDTMTLQQIADYFYQKYDDIRVYIFETE